jgi:surfactin synthase thioesterase subunit
VPAASLKARAFCFYGSGQTAVNLRHLAFPEGVERCLVELPGRGLRASEENGALCDNVSELTEDLAEALRPVLTAHQGDGAPPFVVFAYSLGCAIAYEFIRAVRREYGITPQTFYLSVRRPPGMPVAPLKLPGGVTRPVDELVDGPVDELLSAVAAYYGNPQLAQMLETCQRQPADAGVDSGAGAAAEVESTRRYLFEKLAPMLRNDMSLGASVSQVFWDPEFEDEGPLSCEILAFAAGCATDLDSQPESVQQWEKLSTGGFSLHVIPAATHDGVLRHAGMLGVIDEHLSQAIAA